MVKTMWKSVCLMMAVVLACVCLVGCSSAPAKPSGDTQTKPTETLTADEQTVFEMMDLVNDLSIGVKNTNQLAVVKAAAVLDLCEQTALDTATIVAAAKTYYDTFGDEFKIMFDEKLRCVVEASESLRDEATRAETLQAAGAASDVTWTSKSFDIVKAIGDELKK